VTPEYRGSSSETIVYTPIAICKRIPAKPIILDLCGGTGSWSLPYKENGFDVRVITLPDYDVRTYKLPDEPIYGILAAPPCTMFSMVRTTPKKPRDFNGGMETVKACLDIIWKARLREKLQFWALENPRGYLQQFIGRPYFEFDPTEFGDRHNKRTQLWGYFNIPVKTHQYKKTESIAIKNIFEPIPSDYKKPKGVRNDAIQRSITPKGFAQAFYKQNSVALKTKEEKETAQS
jgi:hypothetical protein